MYAYRTRQEKLDQLHYTTASNLIQCTLGAFLREEKNIY